MVLPHHYQISAFLLTSSAVFFKKHWAFVVMMSSSAVQTLVFFNIVHIPKIMFQISNDAGSFEK